MATIIKTTGERIEVQPKNGTDFQLEELKAIVGGYIEIHALDPVNIIVLNEEGKIHGLLPNIVATNIYQLKTGISDTIVGDVLICKTDEVR